LFKESSMYHSPFKLTPLALAILLGMSPAPADAADKTLGEMVIQADTPAVPANLPATTEGVTAQGIDASVNAATTAETLKYLPSIVVRERYIGDRNAIVATRTTGTLSNAQSMVYADDLLLSNLLGNNYSYQPRWGMVSTAEIARVDVIYGPFSALYPGNSMGGVVLMTTRRPDRFEAHVDAQLFQQHFKLYGTDKDYPGGHGSVAIGNKFGDWSLWLSADHLDTHGQPMSFATASSGGSGATAVTGAYFDTDPNGNPRVIAGAYSIDHTVQDNAKIKLAYDFSPSVRATYALGYWRNDSDTGVESYLRDAAGNVVYNNANLNINGVNYKVSGLNPGQAESEHWMHGLSVKSDTQGAWDWEATLSLYDYDKDIARSASNYGNAANGKLTDMGGTGWRSLDLRGLWRPAGSPKGPHEWSFGYHGDGYELRSYTYNTADWRNGAAGSLNSDSLGKTQTQAVYLQDAWRFAPDWQLVAGGRQEYWRAFDGSNYGGAGNVSFADRSVSAFSPKLALSFQASTDWLLRGSFGKAYRFPTVTEMFQSINYGSGIVNNDPNLKPERVLAGELTAERALEHGLWRISLFREDKRDAIISQTDTTVTPNVTGYQNVDKVRTYGIETAVQLTDLWLRGFDLTGSVTYADSTIVSDAQHPAYEGKVQPRIPDWRVTLVGVYRASDRLSYSLAARYSGRQYGSLDNSDGNGDTYGGTSDYLIVDAKVVYRMTRQWRAELGVDNIGNSQAYVYHPYPQRTVFANLKADF
jgi:iron complex outermembrane receptor protein